MKKLLLLVFLVGCSNSFEGNVVSNWSNINTTTKDVKNTYSVVTRKNELYKVDVREHPKIGTKICFVCGWDNCAQIICR